MRAYALAAIQASPASRAPRATARAGPTAGPASRTTSTMATTMSTTASAIYQSATSPAACRTGITSGESPGM